MPGLYFGPELLWRLNDFAAGAHAAQIVDRLAENGKLSWHDVMRGVIQSLGFTDEQLVVDPAVAGK